jgi:hypothetical protein
MVDVKISEVDAIFHQSVWDQEILYADRSSEDEQLLTRPLLLETKNTNMAGR